LSQVAEISSEDWGALGKMETRVEMVIELPQETLRRTGIPCPRVAAETRLKMLMKMGASSCGGIFNEFLE
jgi:hypothetical protein